jgi:nucleoside-diphosphate-sugar epimerase
VQFIDARDLAAWMRDLCARGVGGIFNANSPRGRFTWADLVGACVAAGGAGAPRATWTPEPILLDAKVEPWTGLPLWLPTTLPDVAGFMAFDCTKAEAAGLAIRSIADTVADTAAWLPTRDNAPAWKAVLTADAEREILATARAA